MEYLWFWTFWHWSKESFRSGMVLRGALHGIAGHWDEWFRHEASEEERRAIASVGKTEPGQRSFMVWLCRRWAPEAVSDKNRHVSRFVLGQLARVPPFNAWPAFACYRTSYGYKGVQAIVLADKSRGEAADVRNVEALILARDPDPTSPAVVTEEFQADATDLQPVVQATSSFLSGKAFFRFLAYWLVCGRRPYARWVGIGLLVGWLTVASLLLRLLFGPEPGDGLLVMEAALVGLWLGLILVDLGVVAYAASNGWKTGTALRAALARNQVRMRMNGGLIVKGGSAGLPFCLNVLSSLARAFPKPVRQSWLWDQFFNRLHSEGKLWAATGVVTQDGRLKPVVLGPKLRACLNHGGIQQLFTPNQVEARNKEINALSDDAPGAVMATGSPELRGSRLRLGFAAEMPHLHVHRCGHVAKVMMIVGRFGSSWRAAFNLLAIAVSAVILAALPDIRSTFFPPRTPIPVAPASPSPYELWVSLDTKQPRYFNVVLESDYWSNRRGEVKRHNDIMESVRAVLPFHRVIGVSAGHEDDGVVWVERRRRFLQREFLPGERVGRYTIPYLTRVGHQ